MRLCVSVFLLTGLLKTIYQSILYEILLNDCMLIFVATIYDNFKRSYSQISFLNFQFLPISLGRDH